MYITENIRNENKQGKNTEEFKGGGDGCGRRLLWAELLYSQTWSLYMRKKGGKARSFIIEKLWWGITARQVMCPE
jgi:hypothetical protein